jgi:hypothetical protein
MSKSLSHRPAYFISHSLYKKRFWCENDFNIYAYAYAKGEELVKTISDTPSGKTMAHAFCSECGCGLWQYPKEVNGKPLP